MIFIKDFLVFQNLREVQPIIMSLRKPVKKGKSTLTEEQRQEIKEAFDLFDTDNITLAKPPLLKVS